MEADLGDDEGQRQRRRHDLLPVLAAAFLHTAQA